LVFRAGR